MTSLARLRKLADQGSGALRQIKWSSARTDTMHRRPLALHPEKPLPPDPPSTIINLPMSEMPTPTEESEVSTKQSIRSSSFAPSEEEESDAKIQAQLHESSRIREAYSNPSVSTLSTDKFTSSETEKVEYFDDKDFRNTDRYTFYNDYDG